MAMPRRRTQILGGLALAGALVLASVLLLRRAPTVWDEPVRIAGTPPLAGAAVPIGREGTRLDVFAIGDDGALWHTSSPDGTAWRPYDSLGTPPGLTLQWDPAVIAPAPAQLDVFAVAMDRTLWVRTWRDDTAAWTPWTPLGGLLGSSPAAATRPGGIVDVVARAASGALLHRYRAADGTWSPWVTHRGALTATPALVATETGLAAYGTARDGDIQAAQWAPSGGWSSWSSVLVRGVTGDLAAGATRSLPVLFFRCDDGQLAAARFAYAGDTWRVDALGGALGAAPKTTTWRDGEIAIFAVGRAGAGPYWTTARFTGRALDVGAFRPLR